MEHAEKNASTTEPLELFQLWILPRETGLPPRYEQKEFLHGGLLVSPDGREGSLCIEQNAFISKITIQSGEEYSYEIRVPGNGVYIFIVSGSVDIAEASLETRDAVGITDATSVSVRAATVADVLVIEVPV